jgi:hypothetical protein
MCIASYGTLTYLAKINGEPWFAPAKVIGTCVNNALLTAVLTASSGGAVVTVGVARMPAG